jgi:hypothetical protein
MPKIGDVSEEWEGVADGRVRVGNAADDGAAYRGWIVGHFVGVGVGVEGGGMLESSDDPARTGAVEVKWGVHPAGERRAVPAVNATATTLSLLVRGRFRLVLPDREVVLAREGDYALWPPGVAHDWLAEEDSVVITVRWPSVPGDSGRVARRG